MKLDIKITPNREGCLGGVDDTTFMTYLKTLMDLNKGLYALKDLIKTEKEINESKNPVGFQDRLLDELDNFYNTLDFNNIRNCYDLISRMLVPEPSIGSVGVIQALEMFCVQGVLSDANDIRFVEMIRPHIDDWEDFSPYDLILLKHLYTIILSSLNHYIYDNFFRTVEVEGNTAIVTLDKSVNTFLSMNQMSIDDVVDLLSTIFKEFTPKTDVLTKDPNKAVALVNKITDSELLSRVLENKELLTVEDVDLILSDKLEVNYDFIQMLENRSDMGV